MSSSTWPRTFRAGPFRWRLSRSCDDLAETHRRENDPHLMGHVDGRQHVLQVASDLPDDEARLALLHELLHVACWHAGQPLTPAQEERLVAAAAPWLLELLRANRRLAGILLED